jgi:hypothetical protein
MSRIPRDIRTERFVFHEKVSLAPLLSSKHSFDIWAMKTEAPSYRLVRVFYANWMQMSVMNRRLGRGRGVIYTSSDARLNAKANATHVRTTCSVADDDSSTSYWSIVLFQTSPLFVVVVSLGTIPSIQIPGYFNWFEKVVHAFIELSESNFGLFDVCLEVLSRRQPHVWSLKQTFQYAMFTFYFLNPAIIH